MNIVDQLHSICCEYPDKHAVRLPCLNKKTQNYDYHHLSFSELDTLINKYAFNLKENGLKRGDKTLLFVKPSLEFHALVFSLFKIGVIPILIDPGMGVKNLLIAIKEVSPTSLIAEPEVHVLSLLYRKTFKTIKIRITTDKRRFLRCLTLPRIKTLKNFVSTDKLIDTEDMQEDETCAILFTSGGTGKPKGVCYSHKIFTEQTRILKDVFGLNSEDVDLPGFPLFSLFTLCMGMTSVIPDMDPSKPSLADPIKLTKNILDNNVTFAAGSPAIWKNLIDYCGHHNIQFETLKSLVMFGAPIESKIHKAFKDILPNGTTYTPYGATESLPVSCVSGKSILNDFAEKTLQGKGTCIGKAVPGLKVQIIGITDTVINDIAQAKILNRFEIGEIIVQGDVVTKSYYENIPKTQLAKISDELSIWHRMGDLGYIDNDDNIWFCGRKAHRVETSNGLFCSVNTEALFLSHKFVNKAALVSKGDDSMGIVIERTQTGRKYNKEDLRAEILSLAKENELTRYIESVHFHDSFPVDIRHNIKIDRKKLQQAVANGKI